MEKVDKRVVRTKRDFKLALLRLVKNKTMEEITVKDICEEANINKMTFYKHYLDKYDLLDDYIKDLAEQIYLASIQKVDISKNKENFGDLFSTLSITALDEALLKREELLSITSKYNSLGADVLKTSIERIVERYIEVLSKEYNIHVDEKSLAAFLVGGFANLANNIIDVGSYDSKKLKATLKDVYNRLIPVFI